jgi:hypothetical protein
MLRRSWKLQPRSTKIINTIPPSTSQLLASSGFESLDSFPRCPPYLLTISTTKAKPIRFARVVSVAQITWIMVQVLARAAKRLAISQLEIAVVAYSSCAIMIYMLRWSRPKDVLVPHTVLIFPGLIPRKITKQETLLMFSLSAPFLGPTEEKDLAKTSGCPISNDCVPTSFSGNKDEAGNIVMGLVLGSTLLEEFTWRHGISLFPQGQSY